MDTAQPTVTISEVKEHLNENRTAGRGSGCLRRWLLSGVVAVASVAALVAVSIGVWIGTNSTRSQTTQLSTWRAIDATFPTPFVKEATTSPNMSDGMTCPSASTCYLVGSGKGDLLGFKSSDGGLNWASLPISGVSLSTRFSCPTTQTCFAGGVQLGGNSVRSVLLMTSDGGASWQTKPFEPEPVFELPHLPVHHDVCRNGGGAQLWAEHRSTGRRVLVHRCRKQVASGNVCSEWIGPLP